jgi:NAD(P)-dependent dehydrogenase (short-subunit alcohol dehydrogenase family)
MSAVLFGDPALADALAARSAPIPADEQALDDTWEQLTLGETPTQVVIVAELPARAAWYLAEADPSAALLAVLQPVFWVARRAAEEWLLVAGGSLVVVCPSAAPDDVLGQASVGALESLVRSIAREYGSRNARSNLVIFDPGHCTLELAPTLAFLLSSRASFVSGERLHLAPEPPCA